ncbi:MAG: 3-deoxy-manno-octulosonate cytidylyltransferase [Flammeovirgaceae bacterium]|nr:3-deoxy-manno-octulosonate cytidylyltransferase [Flammeovirgaceae bacterium]|tara:strand:- start:1741 stop:2478 length:738 start_codon:yes stop_codon:yes gene_type:complete
MKVLGVIPARFASTRFPGKPLADINGKTMIQCVYEQALQSTALDDLFVATDDQRILDEVTAFGGKCLMTSEDHQNGTERCSEVLSLMPEYDYVINIQGDEPYIHPHQIDILRAMLDGNVELATLVKPIQDLGELDDPGEMKVIFNKNQEAIYFSRTCIPYLRDVAPENRLKAHSYYKHIGIYAYRAEVLKEIVKLPKSSLESAESLEQLRWLENGYKIKLGFTNLESRMIDTPADLAKLLNEIAS